MMSTFERPVLSVVSVNTLNKKHNSDLSNMKPTLPNLRSVISSKSFTHSNSHHSHSIQKPITTSRYTKNAEKLKYRLQLAYYKLRTDQVSMPIAEIIKKQEAETQKREQQQIKKPTVTPSLTRHISLLAASTPLQATSTTQKKKVTFKRSTSHLDPPSSSKFSTTKTSSAALSRISEYQRPDNLRSLSSPQLGKLSTTSSSNVAATAAAAHHRSLKIEDLVNNTKQARVDVTPVKGRTDENGDLIMSSPTKKLCSSTPGSYGAAKSLLQLSLISSN